jgi:putative transposase
MPNQRGSKKVLDKAIENRETNYLVLRTNNDIQFRSREFQIKIRDLDISHERTIVNTLF